MPNLWMNRADAGKHMQAFVEGDYMAVGWLDDIDDLASPLDTRTHAIALPIPFGFRVFGIHFE